MDDRKPNIIDDLIGLVGDKAVLQTTDDTASYLSDWHDRFHGSAHAVVLPETTAQVAAIMAYADKHDIIVVPQGGNTGFMGGATPDSSGNSILLSLRRMNKVREIDTQNMSMTVEAGCILQNLQDIAEDAGLYFPLNLAAKGSCTIGLHNWWQSWHQCRRAECCSLWHNPRLDAWSRSRADGRRSVGNAKRASQR